MPAGLSGKYKGMGEGDVAYLISVIDGVTSGAASNLFATRISGGVWFMATTKRIAKIMYLIMASDDNLVYKKIQA